MSVVLSWFCSVCGRRGKLVATGTVASILGFFEHLPAFGDVGLVPFLYPNGLDWTGALVGFFIMYHGDYEYEQTFYQ